MQCKRSGVPVVTAILRIMSVSKIDSVLLGELYEGPLQASPWESFLALVRERLGADLVTLLLRPPSLEEQVVMLADGGSLAAMRSYNEGQFVLDPFVDLPAGEVFTLREYFSGDALHKSEFYRVILKPQGWYDFIGLDLRRDNELDVRFRAGRHGGKPAFGPGEKSLLRDLRTHLERSIRLHSKMHRSEQERAVYAGVVEQLQVATIILDENGLVLSTNPTAQALLQEGRGIELVDGRPRLTDKPADSEFSALLERVRSARRDHAPLPADAMQIPASDADADLGLVARALPPSAAAAGRGTPSIALFINDPQQSTEAAVQVIGRLFDLTPTEASLALLLSQGLSLDEVSGELGISRNTARAHLRAVFAKTGVSRQAGLVRLILRSVAPLAGVDKT
ncbi:MAG: helix-turn-helix transcriptional regulator [Halioglobus sp.]